MTSFLLKGKGVSSKSQAASSTQLDRRSWPNEQSSFREKLRFSKVACVFTGKARLDRAGRPLSTNQPA
jgi:hypothetical protein